MISRPVLRQHTPRYVSHPYRVVVLVAPPSTQEYPTARPRISTTPCFLASLSLSFSFTYFLLLRFRSFSLTILHVRFFLSPFTSFPSPHFPSSRSVSFLIFFLFSLRITLFVFLSCSHFGVTRRRSVFVTFLKRTSSSSLSLVFHFPCLYIVCLSGLLLGTRAENSN